MRSERVEEEEGRKEGKKPTEVAEFRTNFANDFARLSVFDSFLSF